MLGNRAIGDLNIEECRGTGKSGRWW